MPAQGGSNTHQGMAGANPDRTQFGIAAQSISGAHGIYVQPAANPSSSQTNLQRQSGMQIPSVQDLKQKPKKEKPKCERCGAVLEYGECQRCTGTVQAFRPGDINRLT